ncbi:MAG TPA: chemotaxis protein CheD [Rhodocyclaceae bacterium]
MNDVYLEPGDFRFGAAPLRLATLLGSCVSVTLWHPRRHIGGMCHIQMPGRSRQAHEGRLDGHYAEDAFALFDREIGHHGGHPSEYVAKLFGAGNMFPGTEAATIKIGARNLDAARRELARRGLRPAAEHVGGAGHRKLIFDLANGDVWLSFSNLEPVKETAIG